MIYTHQQALTVIESIEAQIYEPNDWELDFMSNVTNRKKELSEKQSECLYRIYGKATIEER